MKKSNIEIIEKLKDFQLWAAEEMKIKAEKSEDSQLKDKYSQIAALNRLYFEKLSGTPFVSNKLNKEESEIKMLKEALFCQSAVYNAFSLECISSLQPEDCENILCGQIKICTDILKELEKRLDNNKI